MDSVFKKQQSWKWLVVFALTIVPLAFPLSAEYKLFLCITIWAIVVWAFDLIQYAVVAVFLPVLFWACKLAAANVCFSGWFSASTWLTIGGLLFGVSFLRCGLAKRIAYKMLSLTNGSFPAIVFALALSCTIVTPIIPSVMGKVVLMVPIAIEMANALGLKKGEGGAAALIMTVFFALWSPKMAFPTASVDAVSAMNILREQYSFDVTWLSWVIDMFVPAMLWTVISVSLVFLFKPGKISVPKATLIEQYKGLGKMGIGEKKNLIMAVLIVVLLATQDLHHIDPAVVMVSAALICFIPEMDMLKPEDFKRTDLSVVFFLAGVTSIGAVAKALGITTDIVNILGPILEGQSNLALVMILFVFAILANFLLNPLALIAILMGPVAELCMGLGFDPTLGAYSMIMGFNHALFPYEIAPFILVYSFGYFKIGQAAKVMAVRIAAGLVFMPLIVYPWWMVVGLV